MLSPVRRSIYELMFFSNIHTKSNDLPLKLETIKIVELISDSKDFAQMSYFKVRVTRKSEELQLLQKALNGFTGKDGKVKVLKFEESEHPLTKEYFSLDILKGIEPNFLNYPKNKRQSILIKLLAPKHQKFLDQSKYSDSDFVDILSLILFNDFLRNSLKSYGISEQKIDRVLCGILLSSSLSEKELLEKIPEIEKLLEEVHNPETIISFKLNPDKKWIIDKETLHIISAYMAAFTHVYYANSVLGFPFEIHLTNFLNGMIVCIIEKFVQISKESTDVFKNFKSLQRILQMMKHSTTK